MVNKIKMGLMALVVAGAGLINSANAQIGRLDVQNYIADPDCDNDTYKLVHYSPALEGFDGFDKTYQEAISSMPSFVKKAKIVSVTPEYEFWEDFRPFTNQGSDLELSLHSNSGNPITVDSINEFRLELDPTSKDYVFGTKPITFQLENGQRYDVRILTNNGAVTGVIPLQDLVGTYDSEVPYATAAIHFKKKADLNNDGKVDVLDLGLFTGNWLNKESLGQYLLGDISGTNGLPDGMVNLIDFAAMAHQDSWLTVQ